MKLVREHGREDARLISRLITLSSDLRRDGEDTRADIVADAMSRIHELTQWIDAEVEVPPNDNVVLAVVNGRLGNISFRNAVEPAQYFYEGWLLSSYVSVVPGGRDRIEIKWWMPLPQPPAVSAMKNEANTESEVD